MEVEGVTSAQLQKPGYTCSESMLPRKLVFVVKVKTNTRILIYFQHLDLIYDLLKW